MVKRDLLEFIERVEAKAIKSVEARFNEQIEEKKAELMKAYDERIGVLQTNFDMFSTDLCNLLADMKEDKEIAFHGNYAINQGRSYLANIRNGIIDSSDFQGEVQKIENAKVKELIAVKANYKKVYVSAKNMSGAKKIAEYLKELGFDISSLEEDECVSLVADIDRSKLFVCGENK